MMPDSLEAIKSIFDNVQDDKKRSDYLLQAIVLLRDEMRVSFDRINGQVNMINTKCLARREICEETINAKITAAKKPICERNKQFLTKSEAKVYGYLFLALSVGIGIGTGIITWAELLRRSIP